MFFLFRARYLCWLLSAYPSGSVFHLSLSSAQVADLYGWRQWAPLSSVFRSSLTSGVRIGQREKEMRGRKEREREVAVLIPLPPPLVGCLGLAVSLDSRSLLLSRKSLLHNSPWVGNHPVSLLLTPRDICSHWAFHYLSRGLYRIRSSVS